MATQVQLRNENPFIPRGVVYRDRQGIMRQNSSDLWCLTCGQYFDTLYGFWRHRVLPVWPVHGAHWGPWWRPWRGRRKGPLVWVTTEDDARRWGLNSDLPGWWRGDWPGGPWEPGRPSPQVKPPHSKHSPLRCLTKEEMTWWCWTVNSRGGWIPPDWTRVNIVWTVTGADSLGKEFTLTGEIPAGVPPLSQTIGEIGGEVFAQLTAAGGTWVEPFALTDLVLQLEGPSAVSGRVPVRSQVRAAVAA